MILPLGTGSLGAQPEGRRLGPGRPRLSRPGRPSGRPGRVTVTVTVTRRPGGPGTSPPPYHPGLPRKGRIYTRPPARCEDSRAIAPYRILEVGASFGRPERPEMRDTRLSAYKRTHVAPRSSYRRIPTFVRTNLAGRAQKLPSARLLSWYDRAKLRSSWLIVVAVLHRERPIRSSRRTRRHQ